MAITVSILWETSLAFRAEDINPCPLIHYVYPSQSALPSSPATAPVGNSSSALEGQVCKLLNWTQLQFDHEISLTGWCVEDFLHSQ